MTVMTLPLTLAVSSLLKSLFILKTSIEWSSFSSFYIVWSVNIKLNGLLISFNQIEIGGPQINSFLNDCYDMLFKFIYLF